jgi:hypothetical protein
MTHPLSGRSVTELSVTGLLPFTAVGRAVMPDHRALQARWHGQYRSLLNSLFVREHCCLEGLGEMEVANAPLFF